MILDEDDDICKQLQSDLLAIWRKELAPCAYEFSKGLIEQKIGRFREQMTGRELISMGLQVLGPPKKSKNQMRREQICFKCQKAWTLDHICEINKEKDALQPSGNEGRITDENASTSHEEQAKIQP